MQSASLCLTTTPAEEMALGLKFWLAPLRVVGAPVDEICMTLLLSLRFMSVVFDELRNLSLGLAARSVPWKQLPPGAGLQVRLFPHLCDQRCLPVGFLALAGASRLYTLLPGADGHLYEKALHCACALVFGGSHTVSYSFIVLQALRKETMSLVAERRGWLGGRGAVLV